MDGFLTRPQRGEALRIAIVLDVAFINGGQAKVAIDSALALKARGHEPVLFAGAGPVAPALTAAGIEVHCLGSSEFVADASPARAALRGLHYAGAAEALGRLLAAQPADRTIVHVHGWAKALSSAITRPIARSGLPTLYSMHDYYRLCPNGGLYDYRRHRHCDVTPLSARCLATQCDTRSVLFKGWRFARLAIGKQLHGLDRTFRDVVYFHAFQRAIIEKHLPAGLRLHEVANPIEVEALGEKPDPASGDMIYLGRISTEKGVLLYAEAARRAGQVPIFVGDGPTAGELREKYPEARILGWQDGAGVRKALRAARALVFPSLLYEGQPLTVLEALALGTPVIAGDGSAGRESVLDGQTGLWFRQNDPDDLAEKLRLMTDDARVAAMSRAAYHRYWADPLTLDRHVSRLEEVYGSLIAQQRQAGVHAAG